MSPLASAQARRPDPIKLISDNDPYSPVLVWRLPPCTLIEDNHPLPVFELLSLKALEAFREKLGLVARGEYAQQFGRVHLGGSGILDKLASNAMALSRESTAFRSCPCSAYIKAI